MFATDEIRAQPASRLEFHAIAASVLGAGLPSAAERHLREAGTAYHRDDIAETHPLAALAAAPDHPTVLIGLYRFYFYKGRLTEALGVARKCLAKASSELGLADDWRRVDRRDADFGSFSAVLPRFFMFTLKGYAYLQAPRRRRRGAGRGEKTPRPRPLRQGQRRPAVGRRRPVGSRK
jgi:hypothetical protein